MKLYKSFFSIAIVVVALALAAAAWAAFWAGKANRSLSRPAKDKPRRRPASASRHGKMQCECYAARPTCRGPWVIGLRRP